MIEELEKLNKLEDEELRKGLLPNAANKMYVYNILIIIFILLLISLSTYINNTLIFIIITEM